MQTRRQTLKQSAVVAGLLAGTGLFPQYAQAFKTDTWQPRPSGLCNGWCPVKTCEFWQPKRNK